MADTAPLRLTPPRRRALLVLLDRHLKSRSGRISNVTDVEEGLVYWQTARWLIGHGLASSVGRGAGTVYVRITEAGMALVTGDSDDLAALDELRNGTGR